MGLYYCDICGGDAFEDTPVFKSCCCGNQVCSYHWDYRNGMCVTCAGTSERSQYSGYTSPPRPKTMSYESYKYSPPDNYYYKNSYEDKNSNGESSSIFRIILVALILIFILSKIL